MKYEKQTVSIEAYEINDMIAMKQRQKCTHYYIAASKWGNAILLKGANMKLLGSGVGEKHCLKQIYQQLRTLYSKQRLLKTI